MTTKPAWLAVAEKKIGYHEGPNNDNMFGRALGLNHEPWCDLFVAWCCRQAKHPLPPMQPGMKTGAASVWYSMQFAKTNGLWRPSWQAQPGDQIVYGWHGPRSAPADMHTGFIVSAGAKGAAGHTIEGNRGDQVGRFTFTVGEDVVLGTIALTKLLGRQRIVVKAAPKPDPQPRPVSHPTHTGPTRSRPQRPDPITAKPKPRKKPAQKIVVVASPYAKAITAFVVGIASWCGTALADGAVTTTEWGQLAGVLAATFGVYKATNRQA